MTRASVLGALAALAVAGPALAGAGDFALVNGAGADMSDVSIRRHGAPDWKPLPVSPPAGAKAPVKFNDPDCAFDIRAKVGGKVATWSGVNLCEVKSVTLKQTASGAIWVDYD